MRIASADLSDGRPTGDARANVSRNQSTSPMASPAADQHQCPRCGHEEPFTPDEWRGGFTIVQPDGSERPICPHCFALFLRDHCGVMQPVKLRQPPPLRPASQ